MKFVWFSLIWFGFILFVTQVKYRVRPPKSIWAPCTHWLGPRNPPPPPPSAFGLMYEGAIVQLK
jgi:hypothetical protein